MNKETPEYERVRERVARLYCLQDDNDDIGEVTKLQYLRKADRFLSLQGIEIKADDQTQPEFLVVASLSKLELVNETRKSMLQAGFIKVI